MLLIPSWIGMINGFLTVFRARKKLVYNPIVRFFPMGLFYYGMTTLEGSLLAIKAVNTQLHYTDWMIAHVHGGGLGWVGSLSFAMFYSLVPRLLKKPLYSEGLMEAHFWLTLLSVLLYVASMWFSGIVESVLWSTLSLDPATGKIIPLSWSSPGQILSIFRQFRSASGGLFILGYGLLLWNLTGTFWQKGQHS